MANDANCYLFKILTEDLGDKRYLKKSDYEKYTLPIATHTTLGGIKVGSGLSIDSSTGVLTANVQAWSSLTGKPFSSVNPTDFTTTSGILSINNATWAKKSDVSNSLSEYYTKEQVDSLVSNLKKATITVVPTLPTTGEEGIIYLVGTSAPYEHYVWEGSAWIDLGSAEIDLSNKQNKLYTNGSAIHINANDSIYLDSSNTGMSNVAVVNCQDSGDGSGNFTGYITNTLVVPSSEDGQTMLDVYAGEGITVNADTLATSVENAFNVWINQWLNAQGIQSSDGMGDLAQETMGWEGFHFPQFINWQDWRIRYMKNGLFVPLESSVGNSIVFRLSSANVKTDESGKVSYQAEINLFDILDFNTTDELLIDAIANFLANETGDTVDNAKLYAKSAYLKIRLSFTYQYDAYDIINVKLNSSLYVMPD
jgi:hypothetical protein